MLPKAMMELFLNYWFWIVDLMEELNLPDPAPLPLGESGKPFPHYFIGDETIPFKYI
jgi:hypothetical protein